MTIESDNCRMKTASVQEIKKKLIQLEPIEISEIVNRLMKFKKDNKELVTYLLYYSSDEQTFIEEVNADVRESFELLKYEGAYKYTKQIRKIIRLANKPIKYSSLPATKVEILINLLEQLKPIIKGKYKSNVLEGIYTRQLEITVKAMSKLHEDIQYDYEKQIIELSNY